MDLGMQRIRSCLADAMLVTVDELVLDDPIVDHPVADDPCH